MGLKGLAKDYALENVELRSVKIHADMSEETNCFSANIYVNGTKIGHVKNDGRGGNNIYYWNDPVAGRQLEAWAKTQPHEFDFDYLDQVIDKILDEQEKIRWLRRNTKGKTLFRLKGDDQKSWRIIKLPFDAKVKTFLFHKYKPQNLECIANEDLQAALAFC